MNKDSVFVYPASAKQKMKYAKENRQPVYIYAMTGFGKTAFTENYLGKTKFLYIDAETAGEDAYDEAAAASGIIVIDNLQFGDKDLAADRIPGLLRRSELWVILISRAKCPDYLMGYKLKGRGFVEITQEDLALSIREVEELLRNCNVNLSREDIEKIHHLSQGHGMTLKITVDVLKQESITQGGEVIYNEDVYVKCIQLLWDYVEREIYEKWDPYFVEIICKLSIVESFSKELAEYITGNSQIELLLKYAVETGNFLSIIDGEYCFDPMVIGSMRRRLEKKYSKEQRDELYYIAGRYYRQHGERKKALELFKSCNNTSQIKDILIDLSRQQPGSSMLFEYKPYYMELSESDIAQSAELMSGMCMLCSLTMNVEKSEYWYECLKKEAREGAFGQKKVAKNLLAYLDLALPHRGSANVISIISNMGTLLTNRMLSIREFSVTGSSISNMNGGKDFCEWSKRDLELAGSIGKMASFVLGSHGKGLVDLCVAESFFEKAIW